MTSLRSLNLPFLLLSYFISTAIPKFPPWLFYIATLISCIFHISTQILDQDFKKIVILFRNEHSLLLLLHNPFFNHCLHHLNHCLYHLRCHQWYHPQKVILKCLKFIICEVWSNNYDWMKCYLRFMSKRSTTCPKLSFFINLFRIKKKYVTNFVQSQFWWIADCGFNGIRYIFIQSFCPGRLWG